MRRFAPPTATCPQRLGLVLLGLLSAASAQVSRLLAQPHAALCGSAAHCGWCYAAVGFALLAVAAFVMAARGAPAAGRRTIGRPSAFALARASRPRWARV
jgi:hypothetical protein